MAGHRVSLAPVDQLGGLLRQTAAAFQHRVRNRQPDGGDDGSGSSPCNTIRRRVRSTAGSGAGTAASGPRCTGGRASP